MGLVKRRSQGVSPKRLNNQQEVFAYEYVLDWNASRAARAAGYSVNRASVKGHELLKHPLVKRLIGKLKDEKLRQLELTHENILRQLGYQLARDIAELTDGDGNLITNLRDLPAGLRACIDGIKAKVEYGEDGEVVGKTLEYKFTSKISAIDLAMKHKNMFDPKQDEGQEGAVPWDAILRGGIPEDKVSLRIEEVKAKANRKGVKLIESDSKPKKE